MKTWYATKDDGAQATLSIFDEIGAYGVSAKSFLNDLKGVKASEVTVEINSYGGDVFAGIAIYNGLRASGKKITVKVMGIAASAASLVAMAGDEIEMPENAMMMIHNPWTFAMGDAEEMRATADVLDKIRDGLVATYAKRTGKSDAEITAMLDDDTWLTAQEALDAGFATKITDKVEAKACFDVENLPENVRTVFAMAKSHQQPPADPPRPDPEFKPVATLADQVMAVAKTAGLDAYASLWAADPKLTDLDAVKARAQQALEIEALCNTAGLQDKADGLIRSGKTLAEARESIFAALEEASPPVDTTPPKDNKTTPTASAQPSAVSSSSIWAARTKPAK